MSENDKLQQKRELTASVNRLVFQFCFVAAVFFGVSILIARVWGQVPSEEYSNLRILTQMVTIGFVMPLCIRRAFWLTALPSAEKWFERLGAVILFVLFPIMALMAILKFINS